MKKMISLCIVLFGLFLIYQFVSVTVKNTHDITYKNNDFFVNEIYKDGYYYIKIDKDNHKFVVSISNKFNKKKNIINEIEYETDSNLMCIYINYINGDGDIQCSDGNVLYSYELFKTYPIMAKLKEKIVVKKYSSNLFVEPSYVASGQKTSVYSDYISDNEKIVLWSYNGFDVLAKKNSFKKEILNFDRYDNTLSRLVGKYYVTPQYLDSKLYETSVFYVFDLSNNSYLTIELPNNLSNNSYVNGVIDNKLYIFDKINMVQYEIDPYKEKAVIVGNKENNCKYYDTKWSNRNIYDFVNGNILFNEIDRNEVKDIAYESIYKDNNSYIYKYGNDLYKTYTFDLTRKIKIISANGINNIIAKNNKIYYIVGNNLYKYEDLVGLRQILTYTEFSYNKMNMISVY